MSVPLFVYVLAAAVRDRLVVSMLMVFLITASLALFLADAAVVEKSAFAIVFTAGGVRIVNVLGLILFVVFFVRRSFDGRDIEFLLSRPVGRVQFICSYALGFSLIAVLAGLASGLVVWGIAPHMFGMGHVYWIASVIIENIIMVNMAFFFAMYFSSAAMASMVLSAFYVLGRMMGQLLGIVDSSSVDDSGLSSVCVQMVSAIMPRLDLMGQTGWLLYGVDAGTPLAFIFLQGLVFCFFVVLAACLDLLFRQF